MEGAANLERVGRTDRRQPGKEPREGEGPFRRRRRGSSPGREAPGRKGPRSREEGECGCSGE